MLTSSFDFDYYIINVYFYDAANQWLEDLGHQPLVSCSSIFESERHDFITIESVWSYEGGFFFILWSHWYLVVSGERI